MSDESHPSKPLFHRTAYNYNAISVEQIELDRTARRLHDRTQLARPSLGSSINAGNLALSGRNSSDGEINQVQQAQLMSLAKGTFVCALRTVGAGRLGQLLAP